jgi:hypothetical protein
VLEGKCLKDGLRNGAEASIGQVRRARQRMA